MPPKTKYGKKEIVELAFKFVRANGWNNLSARVLAKMIGSSTRPIYTHFHSMQEIKVEVMRKTLELLFQYQIESRTEDPFLDMGVGTLFFAKKEQPLFAFITDARQMAVKKQFEEQTFQLALEHLSAYPKFDGFPEDMRREFLFFMWVFTMGLAVILDSSKGAEWTDETIVDLLRNTGLLLWSCYQQRLKQSHST